MKRFAVAVAASVMLTTAACSFAAAQTVRTEAAEHPRLVAAIRDSRAAIVQLRAALAYRARMDRR